MIARQAAALTVLILLLLPLAALAQTQTPAEPQTPTQSDAPIIRCLLPYAAYLPGAMGTDAGPETEPERGAAGNLQADFNGDGCADLAVGAHLSDTFGTNRAGHVEIYYGTRQGLPADGQIIRPPVPEDEAFFGYALAAGDFNNDGYTDLVVGAPGFLVNGQDSAGAIYVYEGSVAGLDPDSWTEWHQASPGVPGGPEAQDFFGRTLAVGDFDGDHYADLAIGIPDEAIGSTARAGYVIILHGSANGITADGAQEWIQNTAGIDGDVEEDNEFGWALAAGDFGLGSQDDLAISVPSQDIGLATAAGMVYVLYGTSNGLSAVNTTTLSQSTLGVTGGSQDFDKFGTALGAGDFDGNGKSDLVVGSPFENVAFEENSGMIHVFYGQSGDELSGFRSENWYQGNNGVPGANEAGDWFGFRLAGGDFNNDGRDDLAIGRPREDVRSTQDAGAVAVLYGTADGLDGAGAQEWVYVGTAGEDDRMGESLTTGDYNGDGFWDLATGLNAKRDTNGSARGSVLVFNGSANRLTDDGSAELFATPFNGISPFRFGWAVR